MNKLINKCYTYYEKVPEIHSDQQELIELCAMSWNRAGWDLIVLDESVSRQHPFYFTYSQTIKNLPTINPKKYEYSCFMRWLAMAQVGGGMMIDYDVINLNFTISSSDIFKNEKLTVFQGHVPCMVYGTDIQYLDICKQFCNLKSEYLTTNHVSDMIMLTNKKIDFNRTNVVSDYPIIKDLVHCSHTACFGASKTKREAITNLLELL